MHHDHIFLRAPQTIGREAERVVVLAQAREAEHALTFELDAQHHDHVGAVDRFIERVHDAHTHLLDFERHQRRRSGQRDVRLHLRQQMNVRTHDARVGDVADDRDVDIGETAEALADGEGIEESLGGMFMRAVAGIDDRRRQPFGEHLRRAGMFVADDDHVGRHRHQVFRGVDQRLAFLDGGSRRREVECVGGKPLLRDLERDAGARRRLHEEIDDELSAERGNFLDGTLADFFEAFGGVEDEIDLFGRKRLDAEEVFGLECGVCGAH